MIKRPHLRSLFTPHPSKIKDFCHLPLKGKAFSFPCNSLYFFVEFMFVFWYDKKNTEEAGEKMHAKSGYIGVFDSGLGGISVLKELLRLMPQERYLYFGDSANAPYGNRTTEQVRELTLAAAEMLLEKGCKALVIACNTATAAAIEALRCAYPDTVIVGIEPALKVAADNYPEGNIGVMATDVTLREEKFHQQLERFPGLQVSAIRVPGLVELVEKGLHNTQQAEKLLTPVLSPYRGKLDAVVLGCTHYPFAKKAIGRLLGADTPLLDGGAGTARETLRRLTNADLLYEGPGEIQMENSNPDPALIARAMALLEESQ